MSRKTISIDPTTGEYKTLVLIDKIAYIDRDDNETVLHLVTGEELYCINQLNELEAQINSEE